MSKKAKGAKHAPGTKGRGSGKITELIIAIVTLINLILTLILRINDRKTVIKAVSDDENVKALLVEKKISQEISK